MSGCGCTCCTGCHSCKVIDWVPTTLEMAHTLSCRAVIGGHEGHDGSPLWVIRAKWEDDLIPGKLAIKYKHAFVAWGSKEHRVNNIEVCCADPHRITWEHSCNGAVPPNAVAAGQTSSGEPLYVARAKHEGSLTPGKVHPSHKVMYMSFGGQEIAFKNYEVLCTCTY